MHYHEQNPKQVAEYLAEIADIPKEQIAYVDEMGCDTFLYREYGWSQRGTPLVGQISGRKFKRTGIVAAQMKKGILEPLQYDGAMDSALFEAWFGMCLLPALPEKTTVVMDNASFHRKKKLCGLAEAAGHRLIFLPPYSPQLNPIENYWSWLKRHLRKTLPLFPSFNDALCAAFEVG